jgi:hypothetical protein
MIFLLCQGKPGWSYSVQLTPSLFTCQDISDISDKAAFPPGFKKGNLTFSRIFNRIKNPFYGAARR